MSYETILYEKKERIATITLNRPEKLNAIRPPMLDELEQAVVEANADHDVRVIIKAQEKLSVRGSTSLRIWGISLGGE